MNAEKIRLRCLEISNGDVAQARRMAEWVMSPIEGRTATELELDRIDAWVAAATRADRSGWRAILKIQEENGMTLDVVDVREFGLDIRTGVREISCEEAGCTIPLRTDGAGNPITPHGVHREYDGTGEVVFTAAMPREQLPQWRDA